MKETVCLATIWSRDAGARSEDFVLRELLREYGTQEWEWALRVVVASAHQEALEAARGVMADFPAIRADFWWLETEHAGTRAEEISFCKEQLPLRLAAEPGWDWLWFYDADVWTRLAQVPEWMGIIGGKKGHCFVKIKYTLRDKLESPAHTLGAYFHHRTLLERLEYWKAVFPRHPDGRRRNAPDCALHDFLERNHRCRKVVPEGIETLHFLNRRDAHRFDAGMCSRAPGVRDEAGAWAEMRDAMPQPSAGPVTMNVVTLWHHEPHPAQARLADYLATAEFPPGSVFVWALAPKMGPSLEAARQALTERGHRVEVVRIEPPAAPIRDNHAKHRRVTELYNRIVPMLGEPTALFMEDDVIPLDHDAPLRLAALLAQMPESSAMVAGAYRSRVNPHGACATNGRLIEWDGLPAGKDAPRIRIRWAGAGLTLFRTSALRSVMPFRFQIDAKARKGWDIFVSEDLRASGRPLWLAPGIRAEHRCPEVIAYCAKHNAPLADAPGIPRDWRDLVPRLAGFQKIVVTGPQRSGTTIATEVLARELGMKPLREEAFGVGRLVSFCGRLAAPGRAVLQAPALSSIVHLLGDPAVAVVFMMRDAADIQRSQSHIRWNGEMQEKGKYLRSADPRPIAEIKVEAWLEQARMLGPRAFTLAYESLEDHPLFVPPESRAGFSPRQTTCG